MIEKCNLVFFNCKADFDGPTGQSIYKQKMYVDSVHGLKKEEKLFLTCLVPLQITT